MVGLIDSAGLDTLDSSDQRLKLRPDVDLEPPHPLVKVSRPLLKVPQKLFGLWIQSCDNLLGWRCLYRRWRSYGVLSLLA